MEEFERDTFEAPIVEASDEDDPKVSKEFISDYDNFVNLIKDKIKPNDKSMILLASKFDIFPPYNFGQFESYISNAINLLPKGLCVKKGFCKFGQDCKNKNCQYIHSYTDEDYLFYLRFVLIKIHQKFYVYNKLNNVIANEVSSNVLEHFDNYVLHIEQHHSKILSDLKDYEKKISELKTEHDELVARNKILAHDNKSFVDLRKANLSLEKKNKVLEEENKLLIKKLSSVGIVEEDINKKAFILITWLSDNNILLPMECKTILDRFITNDKLETSDTCGDGPRTADNELLPMDDTEYKHLLDIVIKKASLLGVEFNTEEYIYSSHEDIPNMCIKLIIWLNKYNIINLGNIVKNIPEL